MMCAWEYVFRLCNALSHQKLLLNHHSTVHTTHVDNVNKECTDHQSDNNHQNPPMPRYLQCISSVTHQYKGGWRSSVLYSWSIINPTIKYSFDLTNWELSGDTDLSHSCNVAELLCFKSCRKDMLIIIFSSFIIFISQKQRLFSSRIFWNCSQCSLILNKECAEY